MYMRTIQLYKYIHSSAACIRNTKYALLMSSSMLMLLMQDLQAANSIDNDQARAQLKELSSFFIWTSVPKPIVWNTIPSWKTTVSVAAFRLNGACNAITTITSAAHAVHILDMLLLAYSCLSA